MLWEGLHVRKAAVKMDWLLGRTPDVVHSTKVPEMLWIVACLQVLYPCQFKDPDQ